MWSRSWSKVRRSQIRAQVQFKVFQGRVQVPLSSSGSCSRCFLDSWVSQIYGCVRFLLQVSCVSMFGSGFSGFGSSSLLWFGVLLGSSLVLRSWYGRKYGSRLLVSSVGVRGCEVFKWVPLSFCWSKYVRVYKSIWIFLGSVRVSGRVRCSWSNEARVIK